MPLMTSVDYGVYPEHLLFFCFASTEPSDVLGQLIPRSAKLLSPIGCEMLGPRHAPTAFSALQWFVVRMWMRKIALARWTYESAILDSYNVISSTEERIRDLVNQSFIVNAAYLLFVKLKNLAPTDSR